LIFARTLGSYFLADDFGEISYVNTICNGEYGLLWLNFTSNFMSVPGMSVWRPWLLVSLLVDFIIWKANPLGFYLTNVLSYNAVVLLLYWLMRQLTRDASLVKSSLVALLTSVIFAVSPLHCESVSWVVGRVDIVCAVFYLLCLCCYNKNELAQNQGDSKLSKALTIASIVFWWLAMWTKEMAIGAPVMAAAMTFLLSQRAGDLKYAITRSLPLWISTVVYFVLRYLALGTILGGYTQGIGDSQAANALLRWLDPDTLRRLLLPFVHSLYAQNQTPAIALATCYIIILTTILVRATSLKINCKWLAFLLVWIATCLAPLYKLWGLGYELEGARFCFFLTMPLAALMPALLLMEPKERKAQLNTWLGASISTSAIVIGLITLTIAAVILGKTAQRTNLEWVHAGKEVRKFLNQVGELNSKVAAKNQEAIVLGIPKRHGGAHMLLNGSALTKGLNPPFRRVDNASHILTFDPILFSENFSLDVNRFKELVSQGKQIAYWDSEESCLKQINLEPAQKLPVLTVGTAGNRINALQGYPHSRQRIRWKEGQLDGPILVDISEGDGLAFTNLDLSPLSADYLECAVHLRPTPGATEATFTANFDELSQNSSNQSTSKLKVKLETDSKAQDKLVRIPLSSNWRWFIKKVNTIFLELPAGSEVAINSVKLRRANEVQPTLTAEGLEQSSEGFYYVEANKLLQLKTHLPLTSSDKKIDKLAIKITSPNAFLENFDKGDDAIEQTVIYNVAPNCDETKLLSLDISKLSRENYRQVQAQCLDAENRQVGERSNPITIKLSQ
jgi:hypothetical protein